MKTWRRKYERAPHKPLLLLLTLGHFHLDSPRLRPYRDVENELRAFLIRFGPPRSKQGPEHPLLRLQRDGLWELLGLQPSHFDASGQLRPHLVRERAVVGVLPEEVHNFLKAYPSELRLAVQ